MSKVNMRSIGPKYQLGINMISAIVSYGLSLLVSFFLSPYIVNTVGVEANGFITLANNFVTYASLLTIALNSMASRFVTIKLEQGKIEEANIYYNSVLAGNIVMCIGLAAVAIPCLIFLEYIIAIPNHLIYDVKLLFLFIFLNFLFSIFSSTFAISTFATNRLYLTNVRTAESQLIRVVILLLLFLTFSAYVSFVGVATLLSTAYLTFFNLYYRKKLLPQIHLKRAYVKLKAVLEVVASGIWNTITRLGQILLNGLDILIANLFINPTAMGVLSLAKVLPQAVLGLVGAMANVFTPDLTIDYAKGNISSVVKNVKYSMKVMSVIVTLPIVVIIVIGDQFFQLWTPTQDANLLHLLSILGLSCVIVSGGINVIYNIFTVVNKLKLNALTVLLNGAISTCIVFLLLKTTNLGLIAIVATSEIVGLVRILVFVVPYGAKCLNQPWYTFYPEAIRPLVPAILSIALGYLIKGIFPVSSWVTFILFCIVLALAALCLNIFILLNREDRANFKSTILNMFRRRKNGN